MRRRGGTHQGQQCLRTAATGRTHDCKRHLHHAPHDLLHRGGHPDMTRRSQPAPAASARPMALPRPSPLEGEGREGGGGRRRCLPRIARWHRPSRANCAQRSPTRTFACGLGCGESRAARGGLRDADFVSAVSGTMMCLPPRRQFWWRFAPDPPPYPPPQGRRGAVEIAARADEVIE
jgi:hypothetical protein